MFAENIHSSCCLIFYVNCTTIIIKHQNIKIFCPIFVGPYLEPALPRRKKCPELAYKKNTFPMDCATNFSLGGRDNIAERIKVFECFGSSSKTKKFWQRNISLNRIFLKIRTTFFKKLSATSLDG